ncbi:MAG: heavy-metal-associated domain-containing protein [Castellaniella sp.]|uniref:heavy-metal-associated domain-containing protein n=1 Tax=Castellaniella sp. TaxID=1955812 RepID=UPI00120B3603|nr:heavy metal-associated domain-containing protein [Castellaniella sp.]TAN29622.1 MAG: heavy-metal-associated domain-containing protein [Castellaniella sp.]
MLKSVSLKVTGDQKLHCESCEQRVSRVLSGINGVHQAKADATSQRIDVLFDPTETEMSTIIDRLGLLGYTTNGPVAPATPN